MGKRLKMGLTKGLRKAGVVLVAGCFGCFGHAVAGFASFDAVLADGDLESAELSTDLLEVPVEIPIVENEIPEEILRTEIITGARSPITGEPMTAAEYAQLQAALDEPVGAPLVSDDIRYLVFLLQIRRAVRPILPFIP